MKQRFCVVLGLSLVGSLLAACGDDSAAGGAGGTGSTTSTHAATSSVTSSTTDATASSTGSSMEQPTIILSVDPTTFAAGSDITGTVTVTNFVLEAPHGQPNQSGHGHFHIYLDDAVGGNYLVAGQTPTISIPIPASATPGPHTLRASLGQNSHAEITPAIEDVIDITIQ